MTIKNVLFIFHSRIGRLLYVQKLPKLQNKVHSNKGKFKILLIEFHTIHIAGSNLNLIHPRFDSNDVGIKTRIS